MCLMVLCVLEEVAIASFFIFSDEITWPVRIMCIIVISLTILAGLFFHCARHHVPVDIAAILLIFTLKFFYLAAVVLLPSPVHCDDENSCVHGLLTGADAKYSFM